VSGSSKDPGGDDERNAAHPRPKGAQSGSLEERKPQLFDLDTPSANTNAGIGDLPPGVVSPNAPANDAGPAVAAVEQRAAAGMAPPASAVEPRAVPPRAASKALEPPPASAPRVVPPTAASTAIDPRSASAARPAPARAPSRAIDAPQRAVSRIVDAPQRTASRAADPPSDSGSRALPLPDASKAIDSPPDAARSRSSNRERDPSDTTGARIRSGMPAESALGSGARARTSLRPANDNETQSEAPSGLIHQEFHSLASTSQFESGESAAPEQLAPIRLLTHVAASASFDVTLKLPKPSESPEARRSRLTSRFKAATAAYKLLSGLGLGAVESKELVDIFNAYEARLRALTSSEDSAIDADGLHALVPLASLD
jgi:hypothetical protein